MFFSVAKRNFVEVVDSLFWLLLWNLNSVPTVLRLFFSLCICQAGFLYVFQKTVALTFLLIDTSLGV